MKRLLILICVMLLVSLPAWAKDSDGCSPQDIAAKVDEAFQNYRVAKAMAKDTRSALEELEKLQGSLANIEDVCASIATTSVVGDTSPGSGTANDPYAFGVAGDTGEGFSLQLTGFIRPADRIIRNENMFNERPDADETYVILNLALECFRDTTGSCEANQFNFQLVGDRGIIYDVPIVVFDDMLDTNVLGGTSSQGSLPFLVKKDDTNLQLVFRPNMFVDDGLVYYAAEPSAANGIQITASANVNVRSGPGTNFSVAGNLAASTPVIAFARNGNGTWLKIAEGWVFRDLVSVDGDVQQLPVTAQ